MKLHKVTANTMKAMVRYHKTLKVQLLPCKMRYDEMWITHYTLTTNANNDVVSITDGMAFVTMLNYWLYYNANNEMGYYPHYYVNHDAWVKYNNRALCTSK